MQRNSIWSGAAFAAVALTVASTAGALAAPFDFNGAGENQRDDLGFYYIITGGKFAPGQIPNGDNASGGTMRFLLDDPAWGAHPLDTWNNDDWFTQNAGFALTLKNGSAIVFDNNGIEDDTYGDYYQYTAEHGNTGLYRGYSMTNNFDWIYATYIKLEQDTTITQMIGYFDPNGNKGDPYPFQPNSPEIGYLMNFWGANCVDNSPTQRTCDPNAASFLGNVFTSFGNGGTFSVSDSGVDRVFSDKTTEDIYRLTYTLDQPIVLPAGEYFFSHSAYIKDTPEPGTLALLGAALAGLGLARRRRR